MAEYGFKKISLTDLGYSYMIKFRGKVNDSGEKFTKKKGGSYA